VRSTLVPTLPRLDAVLEAAGDGAEILAGTDVPAQRNILGDLIERVVPERVGYGKYEAQIECTPLGKALRRLCNILPDDRATAVAAG
jgi:hypothetical protein